MVGQKQLTANVSGIVNHALYHYDKFLGNGVLTTLNLGYFNDDLLNVLGVKRVTVQCKEAVVKAFTHIGIPATFVDQRGLKLVIDQKNLPVNWRSLVQPI